MRLFGVPGGTRTQTRAALLTPPFDGAAAARGRPAYRPSRVDVDCGPALRLGDDDRRVRVDRDLRTNPVD